MKSSVEKLSATRTKITVEVPFEELKPEFDKAFASLSQQVNIPGFRKGKVPAKLLEARLGRGMILDQVINEMLPSRYSAAVDEHELKVLGQPSIDITELEDNDHVTFTAEVDVRPEIDVPDFSKIVVEVAPLGATDEGIDEELTKLQSRFGSLKDADRKAKKGDFVTIDIAATVDGETVEEATTEGLSHEVGSDNLIEGLDEAIAGLKAGEDKTFTSKINHGEHANEDAEVTVKVISVKERELPELDDDFAQLASEFDTIDELRDSLKNQVEAQQKNVQAAEIRDKVLAAALEQTTVELPEAVVQDQVDGQVQQIIQQFGGDEKVFESMLAAQDLTREKFEADARESAEDSVRTQLFLDALADVEEPNVSQEELMDHISFTAAQYGMDPNQFIMQLQQAGQLGSLFADLRRGKALALNIAKVSVKDTDGNDVDVKEFFGEEEADKAEEKQEEKKPDKKSTAKKSTAKKSTAKKSTAKKTTAKKSTAKKSTAKKSTAKKTTAKKSTAKKAAAKKDD